MSEAAPLTTPPPDRSAPDRRHRLAGWLAPALILFAAAFVYLRGLDSAQSYHPDEGEWIFAGSLYSDLFFFHHDFANPLWDDQLGTWGSLNPPAGKYLIGLSTNLFAGLEPMDRPPRSLVEAAAAQGQSAGRAWQTMATRKLGFFRYSFDKDLGWNRANGRIPPARILAAGRRGVALGGLTAGLCVFLIARLLWGGRAGWIALALFLANPMIYAYSRRAMTDLPCLAFVLLGLYGLMASVRAAEGGGRGRWLWPLLAGVGWALALATKLSALAPYGAALLFTAGWMAWQGIELKKSPGASRAPLARAAGLLGAMILLPAVLFIATNPFLYHGAFSRYLDFPTKFNFMLHLGQMIASYQPQAVTVTWTDKLTRAASFLASDASLFGKLIHVPLDALAFPVAAAMLLGDLVRRIRPRRNHNTPAAEPAAAPLAALLAVSLGAWGATVAWLPLTWDRLMLPLVPFFVLALAFGIEKLIATYVGHRANFDEIH